MNAFKRIVSCVAAAAAAALMLASCEMSVSVGSEAEKKIDPLGTPTSTVAYADSHMAQFAAKHPESSQYITADWTKVTADSETTKHVVVAFDGADMYFNVVENGNIMLTKTEQDTTTMYILITADKTAYKMSSTSDASSAESTIAEIVPADKDEVFDSGTLTLDGQTLHFESISSGEGDDKSTIYYCFAPDSAELLYFVTETATERNIYKVNEITSPADASLFVVPSDYKISDYSLLASLPL